MAATAHAQILHDVQQSVSLICSDAAKNFLRHHAASAEASDADICRFLAAHFEAAAEAKRRENVLCVSQDNIAEFARWLFQPAASGATKGAFSPAVAAAASFLIAPAGQQGLKNAVVHDAAAALLSMPRIAQRDISAFLASRGINSAALPEAFEMARAVQQLALKAAAGSQRSKTLTVPSGGGGAFGTVNAVQFFAVFAALSLVHSFYDLFALVMESVGGGALGAAATAAHGTAVVQMCCACWALVDGAHRDMWTAAAKLLALYPGATLPLLLELVPSIETMGQPGSSFVDDVESKFLPPPSAAAAAVPSSSSAQQARIVSYNPDDEQKAPAGAAGASADDDADDDEEEEEDADASRARQDFWAGLTAARN